MPKRFASGRWLLLLVAGSVASCSTGSGGSSAWYPVATPDSSPLRLEQGPAVTAVDLFVAEEVEPGEQYWTGMSTVVAAGSEPVTIEAASVVTRGAATEVGVFVGTEGVDGTTGSNPRRPPGDDLPGEPVAAGGHVIEPGGEPTVVYAVAELSGGSAGGVLGAVLTLRSADGSTAELLALSPTVLCRGAYEGGKEKMPCVDLRADLFAEASALLGSARRV